MFNYIYLPLPSLSFLPHLLIPSSSQGVQLLLSHLLICLFVCLWFWWPNESHSSCLLEQGEGDIFWNVGYLSVAILMKENSSLPQQTWTAYRASCVPSFSVMGYWGASSLQVPHTVSQLMKLPLGQTILTKHKRKPIAHSSFSRGYWLHSLVHRDEIYIAHSVLTVGLPYSYYFPSSSFCLFFFTNISL